MTNKCDEMHWGVSAAPMLPATERVALVVELK